MQTPNDENDLEQGQDEPEDLNVPEGQDDSQAKEDKTDVELLEEKREAAQLTTGQAKEERLMVQA